METKICSDPKGHSFLTLIDKSIDVIAMYKVGLYILHTTDKSFKLAAIINGPVENWRFWGSSL